MSKVITEPNIPNPRGFYSNLISAHRGLNDLDSTELNARMVLILANHIGDPDVLNSALEMARTKKDAQLSA